MLLSWAAVSHSAPQDTSAFTIQQGGFVELYDGAYVQGSKDFGGIQPDYKIDLNDPDLENFVKEVKEAVTSSYKIKWLNLIGKTDQAQSKTIELVTALVQKALPLRQYNSAPYLEVLKEHRLQNMDISLGSYLRCAAGVCRENALVTHVTLKALGIDNRFVYVVAQQGHHQEDHAIVVVKDKSGRWIVDPYNSNFHGRNFDDLLLENKTAVPRLASFAKNEINFARIVRVNNYPTYWLPKKHLKNQCTKVFTN